MINRFLGKYITMCLAALMLLTARPGVAQTDPPAEGPVYHIGISSTAFGNVNRNDAIAALKVWADTIEKELNVTATLKTTLLTESEEIVAGIYNSGKYDGYALAVTELAGVDTLPEYVYLGNRGKDYTLSYVLLGHVEGDLKTSESLADGSIVSCDNNQMILGRQWLTAIACKSVGEKGKQIFPRMEESFSKAILKVFFRQADAAVVTRESFDLACELNPQLRKKLTVIEESPPLILVVFTLSPISGNPDDLELLEKMILNVGDTPGGKQMLTVIQSSKLEKAPISVLETTFQFIREYNSLMADTSSPDP